MSRVATAKSSISPRKRTLVQRCSVALGEADDVCLVLHNDRHHFNIHQADKIAQGLLMACLRSSNHFFPMPWEDGIVMAIFQAGEKGPHDFVDETWYEDDGIVPTYRFHSSGWMYMASDEDPNHSANVIWIQTLQDGEIEFTARNHTYQLRPSQAVSLCNSLSKFANSLEYREWRVWDKLVRWHETPGITNAVSAVSKEKLNNYVRNYREVPWPDLSNLEYWQRLGCDIGTIEYINSPKHAEVLRSLRGLSKDAS